MNRSTAAVLRYGYTCCRKTICRGHVRARRLPVWLLGFVSLLLPAAHRLMAADWLTFGHDPQRTGWASEEHAISPENAGNLTLLWKAKVDSAAQGLWSLTAPVVAENVSTQKGNKTVVYVAGISGTLFALAADSGEELWRYTVNSFVESRSHVYVYQGGFLCPNGTTATPVIDKSTNTIYVIGPDGMLYGLDLGSGMVRYGPVQFVAPFSKNWSLNLVNGRIYTTLSQGCGNGTSGFYSIDVRDRHHPVIEQGLLSNTNTAGVWGRGGPVIGQNGRVYGGAADGMFDPAAGDYSNSVVAEGLDSLGLVDYFLPPNWLYLNRKDFDLGSTSPVYFGWRNRNVLAHGAKEGVVYLLDADALGGKDHQTPLYVTPRLGNDRQVCCEGVGIWGALSTARDASWPDMALRAHGRTTRSRWSQVPVDPWRYRAGQHDGLQGGGGYQNRRADAHARVDCGQFRSSRSRRDRKRRALFSIEWRKCRTEGWRGYAASEHASSGTESS